MILDKLFYTATEVAEIINVSVRTLYRWEEKGFLVPHRTHGGHRRYPIKILKHYLRHGGECKK